MGEKKMKFDREKIKSLIENNGFEDVGDVQGVQIILIC